MTPDRSKAYGRVVHILDDVGAAKLLPAEQDAIRQTADTLLFASSLTGSGAREALEDIAELAERLVESGRWTQERADELADAVGDCGPLSKAAR